jgi:hypothetical protein
VAFLEKQISRNDEEFSAKYRDFSRKIEELDVTNRRYREAIQKIELQGGYSNELPMIETKMVNIKFFMIS